MDQTPSDWASVVYRTLCNDDKLTREIEVEFEEAISS
jgi:hypothetical protein